MRAFPGADVEAALVQRALDRVLLEITLGEKSEGVRADVAGGEEITFDPVKRHTSAGDDDLFHVPVLEIGRRRNSVPVV